MSGEMTRGRLCWIQMGKREVIGIVEEERGTGLNKTQENSSQGFLYRLQLGGIMKRDLGDGKMFVNNIVNIDLFAGCMH